MEWEGHNHCEVDGILTSAIFCIMMCKANAERINEMKMKKKQTFRIWICGNRHTIAKHFEGSMDNVSDQPELDFADMFIKNVANDDLYFSIKNRIEKSELDENDIQCRVEIDESDEYNNHLWVCSKILPSALRKIVEDAIRWEMEMLQEVIDVTSTENVTLYEKNNRKD